MSLCPSGCVRAAGLRAEPRACVCPPQTQRWRSENFERPVDLEGSGDDDSFPDDELDDLYSGSGSGCKYLPFLFLACVSCWPRQSASSTHARLISGHRAPCRLTEAVVCGRGGQAGVPRGPQAHEGLVILGMEPGPLASTPRTPSSHGSALRPRLQVGTQTSLRNPVFSAVPTLGGA